MKLQIVSDLHLEFSPIHIPNAGSDVLVLSGDICVASYFRKGPESPRAAQADEFLEFFEQVNTDFDKIFYVPGNHEFYYGYFDTTVPLLKSTLKSFKNIRVLDNEYEDFGGFRFLGTTLWTDMWNSMESEALVQNGLNDYRLIQHSHNYRKLRGHDTVQAHRRALEFIELYATEPCIVLGHHGPSKRSVTPEYISGGYSYLNPGYVSELDDFIRARPEIKLWTHGHVHSSHDYDIGSTRIVANPRGYNTENKNFDAIKIVQI